MNTRTDFITSTKIGLSATEDIFAKRPSTKGFAKIKNTMVAIAAALALSTHPNPDVVPPDKPGGTLDAKRDDDGDAKVSPSGAKNLCIISFS